MPRKAVPGADKELKKKAAVDLDQAASEADQTLSDADQTASDQDQNASDADRSTSQTDQRASDRDQAAADRDLAEHPEDDETARVHAISRTDRELGTQERDRASLSRFKVAAERDARAATRDRNSRERDLAARARDEAAEELDQAAAKMAPSVGSPRPRRHLDQAVTAAVEARTRASADRAQAAEDRARAAADREHAARDRREASAELEQAHLDALTGAYQRGMGELALGHELARAQRSDGPLVFAYVDVDGLKAVNDLEGHAAGDELLRAVVAAIQAKLRAYDPIVRVGGDEFVCAISNTDEEGASARFAEVNKVLSTGSISVGLSAMRPHDTVSDLMERSDAAMRRTRE